MSVWGGDRPETDLLRPSPAARPTGARERAAAGSWDRLESPARRGGSDLDGPDPGRRRDLGRKVVVALVAAAIAAAVATGPLKLFDSPDARPSTGTAGRSAPLLPAPMGAASLRQAVAVSLDPLLPPSEPCPKAAGIRCTPPAAFLTVDEVRGVRAVDRAGGGAAVRLTLTGWDAVTLAAVARPGGRLKARVGAGAPVPAAVQGGALVLAVPDRAAAVRTVAGLGLAPAPRPEKGPGALGRPMELWAGTAAPGPCRVSAAGRGVLVLDRAAECVRLRGPAVTLRSVADLKVTRPNSKVPSWVVSLEPTDADRAALARLTREQARTRGRIAFVVGGRLVTGLPTVTREASGSIELGVADEAESRLLVHRLRP